MEHEIQLTSDGGVKKSIVKEGDGDCPPLESSCHVYYEGRLFPSGIPFDNAFSREKGGNPFIFELGVGHAIPAWDICVQSMKKGEKCIMRCGPEYAFGRLGCPPRIPGDSWLEFQIELLFFERVKSKPEIQTLEQRLQTASRERIDGNEFFKNGSYRKASKCYNKALSLFGGLYDLGEEDEKKVKDVKLPIYTNLSLCCLKLNELSKAIKFAEKALEIDPKNSKAQFFLGKSFMEAGELSTAKTNLMKAVKLAPNNVEIRKSIEEVNKRLEEEKLQKKFQQPMFFGMFK